MTEETGGLDLHDHAEHHENVPQRDEDSKVSEAQQELPDVCHLGSQKAFSQAGLTLLFSALQCASVAPTRPTPPAPVSQQQHGLSFGPPLFPSTLSTQAIAANDQPPERTKPPASE